MLWCGVNDFLIRMETGGFFAAYVDEAFANTIRLGDEGQTWRLKSPEEYASLPNNIVRFSDRLKMYLSGIYGNFFESPPAR